MSNLLFDDSEKKLFNKTETQKLSLNEAEVTETEEKLFNINQKLEEFNQKVLKMKDSVENLEVEYGISYLDGKNIFSGLYLKTVLEKSKIIDLKLSNQISKHHKIAEEETVNKEETIKSRILDDNEEETEEKEKKGKETKKFKSAEESKYRAQNLYFDFTETNQEKKERKKNLEKAKDKLKNSEFYKEMIDELDTRPEEYKGELNTNYGKFMKEVNDYEENMMTKVLISKRKIKDLKKKDKKEEDLSNFNSELKNLSSILGDNMKSEEDSRKKENAYNKMKKKLKLDKKEDIKGREENSNFRNSSKSKKFLGNKRNESKKFKK